MHLVCLDLEGVLIPEIWIAFAEAAGIPELRRTTRDEPDYDKLMCSRISILRQNALRLPDIQNVIAQMDVLPGALEFLEKLKERTQLIILSDTFMEFAGPLMKKLNRPTLFCNSLEYSADGTITGYKLRQKNGKQEAIRAFASLNIEIFAAGDSFNDLDMIKEAKAGCLFRAPDVIRKEYSDIPCVDTFDELFNRIENWIHNEL